MVVFRIVCLILAIVTVMPLYLVGCGGNTAHVCESKCPTCGYCTNKECKEDVCKLKCKGHKTEDDEPATIASVRVAVKPKKTSYYPGDVFDPKGLVVEATLSNGKKKSYFDKDLTEYTHKGEALKEEVDKITFTIPDTDVTFDVEITVGYPTDLVLSLDTSKLKDKYTNLETIDFSVIDVKLLTSGTSTLVEADKWKLYKGTAEITDKSAVAAKDLGLGEITLTVQYLPGTSKDFVVTVVDANSVITPAFVEAEECAYKLDENGNETDTPYTYKESSTHAEYYAGDTLQFTNVKTGSSGTGAMARLSSTYNGKTTYFKFKVTVPAKGNYKLKARAQAVTKMNIQNKIAVNINGKKGEDGKFEFTLNNKAQYVALGNQMSSYCDLGGKKYTQYYNMFWWGVLDIGTFELEKGENEIRIYMPNGLDVNIDYFEVTTENAANTAKIMSMRSGARVDLSRTTLYIKKGEKLTDILAVNALHPLTYTLLYIRLSNGTEVPVLGSMIEGKVNYDVVGVEQTIEVTDPVSKETASFTLVVENVQS